MKTRSIFLTALAALTLAGCTKTANEETIVTGPEEVRLSGGIQTAEVQNATVGRSTSAFEANKTFTLFVEDNAQPARFVPKERTGKTVKATSESTINEVTLEPEKLYWDDLGGKTADIELFGVYHPGVTSLTPVDGVITWPITSNVEESDLMRAYVESYEYGDKSDPAHLEFEHVLSKISIVLIPGDGYSQAELDKADINFNIPKSVKYDYTVDPGVRSGTTIDGDVEKGIEVKAPEERDGTTGFKTYTVLSFPLVEDAGATLAVISIPKTGRPEDPDKYNVLLGTGGVSMEAGKHYKFNVTVIKSDVTVTATVVDWDTDPGVVEVDSRLIAVDKINIADASTTTKLTTESKLYLRVTDQNGKTGNSEYTYTVGSPGTWTVVGTPLYWDDFKRPIKTEALLMLNGVDAGENIMTATNSSSEVAATIPLGTFTRPFSKITVIVTTSEGSDKVTLEGAGVGLTDIKFTNSYNYSITNSVNVSENRLGGGLVQVLSTSDAYDSGNYTFDAYIMPTNSYKEDDILCVISIQETTDIKNPYNLKLPEDTNFQAGYHYTYTVKIVKSEGTVTATLVDWKVGNGDDGEYIETGLD